MKLCVEFPSVSYREGPENVIRLAKAIEDIGYDRLEIFDHVIMGYPTESREPPMYPSKMPIMEALTTLAFIAGNTERIGLGTEVLVLPQRQPVLVAKQVQTIDTLSGGRMRLGIGVGWQESEYEMLEESFSNRGRRMDDAIEVLRTCWRDELISYEFDHYSAESMAMEPKSPQGSNLPVWVGGMSDPALARAGKLGDGWLANAIEDEVDALRSIALVLAGAESAGKDPDAFGLQMMLDVPPRDDAGRMFYRDLDRVKARAEQVEGWGFEYGSINATAIFQSGARSVDAIIDVLENVHRALA
ncbi:MAG: TIGR03619 family F420-dependent LLM class oxidoreductase [Gammaproteobacteria bacterium]|nr:TIGR03619 family F420-dependent LLM class oxidoreductase [Gammaproteobacteria bacterium]